MICELSYNYGLSNSMGYLTLWAISHYGLSNTMGYLSVQCVLSGVWTSTSQLLGSGPATSFNCLTFKSQFILWFTLVKLNFFTFWPHFLKTRLLHSSANIFTFTCDVDTLKDSSRRRCSKNLCVILCWNTNFAGHNQSPQSSFSKENKSIFIQ